MIKKSILQRQKKRIVLVKKYKNSRKLLSELLIKTENINEKFQIHSKLEKLPRDSAQVRLRNRCWKTGRARGYFRFFGLCRHALRKFGHEGILPGVIKASW